MKQISIIIIALIIAISIIIVINIISTNTELKEKGIEIFGSDYCNEKHSKLGGDALTAWTCKLCGYSDINPDTDVPVICNKCANLTGRCMECGKLEK